MSEDGDARPAARCLIIDDDDKVARAIGWMLEERGHEVCVARDPVDASSLAEGGRLDVAIIDIRLGSSSGLELIPELRRHISGLPAITMTGHPCVETAAASVRLGAVAYLTKPVVPELLYSAVERAQELYRTQRQLTRRLSLLSAEQRSLAQLVDSSKTAQLVVRGGHVLYATPRAEELLDLAPGELYEAPFPFELSEGTVRSVTIRRDDGSEGTGTLSTQSTRWRGEPALLVQLEDDREQLSALDHLGRLATAVDAAAEAILVTDGNGVIQYVNPAFESITGYPAAEALGQTPSLLKSGCHDAAFYHELWNTIRSGKVWAGRIRNRRKDGSLLLEEGTISPVRDGSGAVTHFVAVKRDVTDRDRLEAQLLRAQKLEGIGQLAAGIAHEINTPTQYISDNTVFVEEAFRRVLGIVDAAEALVESCKDGQEPDAEHLDALRTALKKGRLKYLRKEIPRALEQSLDGLRRVSHIVGAMKDFAHPSQGERTTVDLHHLIDNTITVSRNEWKYVADVERDFDESLASIPCYRDELGQALLNMIVNAAHAIEDTKRDGKGTIRITTHRGETHAEVHVGDNGKGIPPAQLERIFEPFFTTKPQGKGTGQGLAIAHDVVVTKHGGALDVRSSVGEGTTFIMRLPLGE